jgi:hypothetical protein
MNPPKIQLQPTKVESMTETATGDCVVFAITVWHEMGCPDLFEHTGDSGAYTLQENGSIP